MGRGAGDQGWVGTREGRTDFTRNDVRSWRHTDDILKSLSGASKQESNVGFKFEKDHSQHSKELSRLQENVSDGTIKESRI